MHEQQRLGRKLKLPIVDADGDYDRNARSLKLSKELPLVLEHTVKPLEMFGDGVLRGESRAENQVVAVRLKEADA